MSTNATYTSNIHLYVLYIVHTIQIPIPSVLFPRAAACAIWTAALRAFVHWRQPRPLRVASAPLARRAQVAWKVR